MEDEIQTYYMGNSKLPAFSSRLSLPGERAGRGGGGCEQGRQRLSQRTTLKSHMQPFYQAPHSLLGYRLT